MATHDTNLIRAIELFPGIAAGTDVVPAVDGAWVDFAFKAGLDGEVAQLLVAHVMRRAKVESRPPGNGTAASYRLDIGQTQTLTRSLHYASERMLEPAPPPRAIDGATLPALLSHALTAFASDYATLADAGGIPALPVWSNVLRVIKPGGAEPRSIGKRAILSRRALRVLLPALQQLNWLTILKHPRVRGRRSVQLTAAGKDREAAARTRIAAVEQAWRDHFGDARMDALRRSLAAIADELALELPYYITGYGIADASLTGGSYRAAEPGPPPVPARGQEWPVAVRDRTVHADSLPLSALLSKVLAQFTLDYEGERLGALAWASLFLRHLPDQGISLACARTLDGSLGNGKSGPERHLCVVIEPGKPSDGERMVYPTPKSRRARDAYPALVTTIEERWRDRYGAAATELRAALEAIDAQLPPGIADYPDTNSWLLGHLVRANWMIRDATQRPGCLPWHAGQRQRARPAAHL